MNIQQTQEPASQATKDSSNVRMPSFFVSHRGPTIIDEENGYVEQLKRFQTLLPAKPKAIVIFSAHFESSTQIISCPKKFDTMYDFEVYQTKYYQQKYSEKLYQMQYAAKYYEIKYPAEGDPELAQEIQSLLTENGVESEMDTTRGLDNAAWTILMLMFPEADIPIVSMSVNPDASHEELYKIGKALGPLQDKGVLIMGSGTILHNFDEFNFRAEKPADWAIDFSDWMTERILSWNTKELFDYRKLSRYGKVAAPLEEHIIPYLYPMGAGDKAKKASMPFNEIMYGGMLYVLLKFDP